MFMNQTTSIAFVFVVSPVMVKSKERSFSPLLCGALQTHVHIHIPVWFNLLPYSTLLGVVWNLSKFFFCTKPTIFRLTKHNVSNICLFLWNKGLITELWLLCISWSSWVFVFYPVVPHQVDIWELKPTVVEYPALLSALYPMCPTPQRTDERSQHGNTYEYFN